MESSDYNFRIIRDNAFSSLSLAPGSQNMFKNVTCFCYNNCNNNDKYFLTPKAKYQASHTVCKITIKWKQLKMISEAKTSEWVALMCVSVL